MGGWVREKRDEVVRDSERDSRYQVEGREKGGRDEVVRDSERGSRYQVEGREK